LVLLEFFRFFCDPCKCMSLFSWVTFQRPYSSLLFCCHCSVFLPTLFYKFLSVLCMALTTNLQLNYRIKCLRLFRTWLLVFRVEIFLQKVPIVGRHMKWTDWDSIARFCVAFGIAILIRLRSLHWMKRKEEWNA
jgi:hypothetical protein